MAGPFRKMTQKDVFNTFRVTLPFVLSYSKRQAKTLQMIGFFIRLHSLQSLQFLGQPLRTLSQVRILYHAFSSRK
jgi:hypothetical protein